MSDALKPGEVIGQYTIESELGRGPLGISYRARDAEGEVVAIKVLQANPALTSDEKAALAEDFEALESIQSPQVPVLLEFVRYDDRYVIATDYLPLGDFAGRLARGPLPLPAALTMMRHLTYAVGRAHAAGVVHGGIKPTNVLRRQVGGRQVPVLADFGGELRRHSWMPPARAYIPPGYRAPEGGPHGALTPQGDVFALGSLLSAMTGRLATPAVERIIARATAANLEVRYSNAQDMFDALSALTKEDEVALFVEPAAPIAAVVPESAVVVEPESEPEPEPAPVMEPDPEPTPAPVAVPIPEPEPEPISEPKPAAEPKPEYTMPASVAADGPLAFAALAVNEQLDALGGNEPVTTDGRAAERARILNSASVAEAERGYRSKGFLIGSVIGVALLILALTLLLTRNNFVDRPTVVAPVSQPTTTPGYRSVIFNFDQPAGENSEIQVKRGDLWVAVGGTRYRLGTTSGGDKGCATFRVADLANSPASFSSSHEYCGVSAQPTITAAVDTNNCDFEGQVCYTFSAGGLKPGLVSDLVLKLDGTEIGTISVTVDPSGHATLPDGKHFHFEKTESGKTFQVEFAGLKYSSLVSVS